MNVGNRNELAGPVKNRSHAIAIAKRKDVEVLNEFGFNLIEEDRQYAIPER